ncbi:MAG TPA: sugar ABC transporter permease [Vicinamibacterales bacterium]|nr:sugar ABC transporter permease [Vicinamibacterales bacterium]
MTSRPAASSRADGGTSSRELRLAWALASPALSIIALVALFPILWTFWESLHLHDLRMPWLGRPFVGVSNYVEALGAARFWTALGHTAFFVVASLVIELSGGLLLAMALDRVTQARGLVRTAVLLPWAIPTVVVALVWRFMFESPGGLANALLAGAGLGTPTWFADAAAAWVPLLLADAWKTTPFVAILLLAGLQTIDRTLYEAAEVDGAGAWRQFADITLPLLKPALLVAGLFRSLDAFRVFDLVYVMTGGGPGTATEPIALYTFITLLQNLRFGLGSALSIVVFAVAFFFALGVIRLFGSGAFLERAA